MVFGLALTLVTFILAVVLACFNLRDIFFSLGLLQNFPKFVVKGIRTSVRLSVKVSVLDLICSLGCRFGIY